MRIKVRRDLVFLSLSTFDGLIESSQTINKDPTLLKKTVSLGHSLGNKNDEQQNAVNKKSAQFF